MDERFHEMASAQEQRQRDVALAAIQARSQGRGRADCDDCGEPIPAARRKAAPHAIRCITCQSNHERRRFK
ncbi:MAG: TraR/DksA C4-type zinc finger protein [Comamonas sp.]